MHHLHLNVALALLVSAAIPADSQNVPATAGAPAYSVNDGQRSVWEALRRGQMKHAAALSQALLDADPSNALGCAGLVADSSSARSADEIVSIGRRGLRNVSNLRPLEGMSEPEFAEMSKRLRVILNSAVGQAYLNLNDHLTGRKYLKEVVALNPNSARDTYIAGQAFLNGKNPDPAIGYWLLARTVVLARDTPAGKEIGQYSYERYLAAGGREENWKKYLDRATSPAPPLGMEVATVTPLEKPSEQVPAPSATATVAAASGSPVNSASDAASSVRTANSDGSSRTRTQSSEMASATSAPTGPQRASIGDEKATVVNSARPSSSGVAGSSNPARSTTTSEARAATQPATPTISSSAQRTSGGPEKGTLSASIDRGDLEKIQQSLPQAEGQAPEPPREIADNIRPSLPTPPPANVRRPTPREPRVIHRVGEALSLGILIQAKVASPENRSAVIYALSDMLRRLRDDDEAFIVSYSRGIGFEQDLTWNYDMLEQAMDKINPDPGADLLDAVAFSAGHLARVAKNPNRVLIVISDGANDFSQASSLGVAAELHGSAARVYCIGIGVGNISERTRLQELADRTGGGVTFIAGSDGFRHAIHKVAGDLGIDFQE